MLNPFDSQKTKTAEFSINNQQFQSNCLKKSQNYNFIRIEKIQKTTILFWLLVFNINIQYSTYQKDWIKDIPKNIFYKQYFMPGSLKMFLKPVWEGKIHGLETALLPRIP